MALTMTMPRVTALSDISIASKVGIKPAYWVEQATGNSEEDPDIDHQAEAERYANIKQYGWTEAVRRISRGCTVLRSRVCDLCPGEGEE